MTVASKSSCSPYLDWRVGGGRMQAYASAFVEEMTLCESLGIAAVGYMYNMTKKCVSRWVVETADRIRSCPVGDVPVMSL
jgi:hypothetical protein